MTCECYDRTADTLPWRRLSVRDGDARTLDAAREHGCRKPAADSFVSVVSLAFWAAAIGYAMDAGANYGPDGVYAAEQALKLAGEIYAVVAGVIWTVYGFFPGTRDDA